MILPVDQGFEHGPARSFAKNAQGYDPRYHFELAIDAGCNAYAAPLGFLEAGAGEFAGDVPTILKLNNSDSLFSSDDPCSAMMFAYWSMREQHSDWRRWEHRLWRLLESGLRHRCTDRDWCGYHCYSCRSVRCFVDLAPSTILMS